MLDVQEKAFSWGPQAKSPGWGSPFWGPQVKTPGWDNHLEES